MAKPKAAPTSEDAEPCHNRRLELRERRRLPEAGGGTPWARPAGGRRSERTASCTAQRDELRLRACGPGLARDALSEQRAAAERDASPVYVVSYGLTLGLSSVKPSEYEA